MNQRDFDLEIQRLLRRLDLLRAARRGDVQLVPVEVPECTVRRHIRRAHTRYVSPVRPAKTISRRTSRH